MTTWSSEKTWQDQASVIVGALPDATFLTWLDRTGVEEVKLTFGQVWNRAQDAMVGIGLDPGDRALLVYAPGPEFFVAFVGCLLSGVLAVPVYPPDPGNLARGLEKLALVGSSSDATVGLTDTTVAALRMTTSIVHSWPKITWYNTEDWGRRTIPRKNDLGLGNPPDAIFPPDAIAYLQYTSGSTGDPKGVMLSHRNLWHHTNEVYLPLHRKKYYDRLGVTAARRLFDVGDTSTRVVGVSWMPQYHDCGLVNMLFAPFVAGFHMVEFSPLSFLADPLMYLRAISKYRAHFSVCPDFGLDLCTRRARAVHDDDDDEFSAKHRFDLSTLVVLGAGAGHRCVPSQLRDFQAFFSTHSNLPDDDKIFIPSYGLAEHVVTVCGEVDGLVTSQRRSDLASCGSNFTIALRIVDVETRRPVEDGCPGELWLASESVGRGYWGKPELSATTFRARLDPDDGRTWLRTGDEAFLEDGRLFLCGRLKNMIIVGGTNYYADDVEVAVNSCSGDKLRPGCCVAFSIDEDAMESEYLCIVAEVRDRALNDSPKLATTVIPAAVTKAVGLRPRRIVLVKEKTILKTTSGKLRHRAIRDALLAGNLHAVVFDSNLPTLGETVTSVSSVSERKTSASSLFDWIFPACGSDDAITLGGDGDVEATDYETSGVRDTASPGASMVNASPPTRADEHLGEGWLDTIRSRVVLDVDSEIKVALKDDADTTAASASEGAAVRQAQKAYVLSALVRSVELSVAELSKDVDLSTTSVVDLGLSSQDALQLQEAVKESLFVDVNLVVVTDPKLSITDLADTILTIARGEDDSGASRDSRFKADIVPLSDGTDLDLVVGAGLIQLVLVPVVAVVTSIAFIPPYHFGLWVQWRSKEIPMSEDKEVLVPRDNEPWSHIRVVGNVYTYGLLLPLVFPLFVVSLSLVVLVMKWLVIGKYRVGTTRRGSLYFLQWWFVDRLLLDCWEAYGGIFIYDTILMNAFCWLMGATIAATAKINSLPREFDLISIGHNATVSGKLYSRFFEPEGRMRFACVAVDGEVKSTSIVMPGTTIERGAVLDHESATTIGMTLKADTVYRGSPASPAIVKNKVTTTPRRRGPEGDDDEGMKTSFSYLLGYELAKLTSLICFMYGLFFGTYVLIEFTLRRLDWYTWWSCRYRVLAYYSLGYGTAIFAAGLLLVILKVALIGGGPFRPPSRGSTSSWHWRLRKWVLDWIWYRLLFTVGEGLWEENGIVTLGLMKALGVRVAWTASTSTARFFSPVEADLIEIGDGAVLSGFTLSCESENGELKPIRIDAGAQIGYRARINAGVVVGENAVVGHQTVVPEDYVVESGTTFFGDDGITFTKTPSRKKVDKLRVIPALILLSVLRGIEVFLVAFVALIPAYELGIRVFYGDLPNFCESETYQRGFEVVRQGHIKLWRPPMDRNLALLLVGPIALVAIFSMALVLRIWQWLIFRDWRSNKSGWHQTLWFAAAYMAYHHPSFFVSRCGMACARGSPLANFYLWFFGADVSSTAFINSSFIMDPPLLKIGPGAVIDDLSRNLAHVYEHGNLRFQEKIIGPGAILHPSSVSWAGDVVPNGVILGPKAQLGHDFRPDDASGSRYFQGCPARDVTPLYEKAFGYPVSQV